MFLKTSQNSQSQTVVLEPLLNKAAGLQACNFDKKFTLLKHLQQNTCNNVSLEKRLPNIWFHMDLTYYFKEYFYKMLVGDMLLNPP